MSVALVGVLAALCGFGVLKGFRDAPNAVALPARYRALTPRLALILAAVMNALGVLFGALTLTFASWLLAEPLAAGGRGLLALVLALVVTMAWGVLLWWKRIPASTTHALFASLWGASLACVVMGVASDSTSFGTVMRTELLLGLVLGPVLAWVAARLATGPALRLGTQGSTVTVQRRSRIALAISSATIAFGHGVQSGQRMGMLWGMALVGAGLTRVSEVPPVALWGACLLFTAATALGTLGGAWRISWTLTERLAPLDPLRASVAAGTAALLLFLGSILLHIPLSSTHAAVAGIVGAGQDRSYSSVRWGQLARVVGWWLVSPPVCVGAAFLVTLAALALT